MAPAFRLAPLTIALAFCVSASAVLTPGIAAQGASQALRDELAALQRTHTARVPQGAFTSIAYQLDVADRIAGDFAPQAELWRKRARALIELAKRGEDPLLAQRGKISMRAYDSPISQVRQGYAVYLPPNYDPQRAYPLMIMLHGGSANGNLFLGVVLGNNMNWKEYDAHLWDEFTPRWTPDWIVVAPDGFGQVMWRFMGEQDVLDVLDDVKQHYHVDEDRVVLGGLSNGGVGAYNLGMRHAWRFSAVLAIAGAPSWHQYAGGNVDALQSRALDPLSGMTLAENAINTDFRYFHGRVDPGPMRPAYVEEFTKHIATLGVPHREQWFDTGHDLLYLVHRRGRIYDELADVRRNRRPREVRVVTGDYRANRQHWLTVTHIEDYPSLARVRAQVDGSRVRIETRGAGAFEIALTDVPLSGERAAIEVDGQVVYDGKRQALGTQVQLVRRRGVWERGEPTTAKRIKRAGSAGPITDAYHDSMLHVYGTADAAHTAALRKAAQRGARGWPLWLWRVQQPVVADTDVTDEMLRRHHLVLYGTPGANRVLSRIEASLPIRVTKQAVVVGETSFTGAGVGTKFIYPNPLASDRYVLVHAAPTIEGVNGAQNLPDFLPDYVVYDANTTRVRPRLLFPKRARPLRAGYFDDAWQLTQVTPKLRTGAASPAGLTPKTLPEGAPPGGEAQIGDGAESAQHDQPTSNAKLATAPELPPPPARFLAPEDSQAGKAAREIARRVRTFTNYRARIRGATWSVDERSIWSIRDTAQCLDALAEVGVSAQLWAGKLTTPVPVPVRITAPVEQVSFRFMHGGAGVVIACELAARLPEIARIVRRHGVHTVYVLSAYRNKPYPSFHTLGLALDLSRFDSEHGVLDVKTDFIIDHARETCSPTAATAASPRASQERLNAKATLLRAIACDFASSHRFSSVLTPNYNAGHRDHFHIDIRPDDPRIFLR